MTGTLQTITVVMKDGEKVDVEAMVYGNTAVHGSLPGFDFYGYVVEHVASGTVIAIFLHEHVAHNFAKRANEVIPLDSVAPDAPLSERMHLTQACADLAQHPDLLWDAWGNPGEAAKIRGTS